jgi:hypothetical protein
MPNRCTFCRIKKPTNHLILGTKWYEFCDTCGRKETLQRETEDGKIEIKSVQAVFDSLAAKRHTITIQPGGERSDYIRRNGHGLHCLCRPV